MSTSLGSSSDTNQRQPIITLLTDFGLGNPYVASMKAVILSICRKAILIDVTHEVAKFEALQGAYLLAAVAPYFPPETIHVCVVDPGVGTDRKALLVKTKRSYLIGPDNGLLMLAASNEGIEKVIKIRNRNYMLRDIHPAFQGRDIFAPVAAHLASGVSIDEFGPQTKEYHRPVFPKPTVSAEEVVGEIIYIDNFGNIVTNISLSDVRRLGIEPSSTIRVAVARRKEKMRFCKTYGEVAVGNHLTIINSMGFLEISVNRGNAARLYRGKLGMKVTLSRA